METKDLNLKSLAFKVTVVSYVCAILCLVLAVYFIGPQLSGNTSPLWNVQLSIGVWALLFGFFVSAIGLKFVFVPHILALAQKEGQDTCRELGEKLEENHTGTLKTSKCSRTSIELRGKTFKCRFRIGRERWVKVKVKVRGKKHLIFGLMSLSALIMLSFGTLSHPDFSEIPGGNELFAMNLFFGAWNLWHLYLENRWSDEGEEALKLIKSLEGKE
jgi:hypothetical protein